MWEFFATRGLAPDLLTRDDTGADVNAERRKRQGGMIAMENPPTVIPVDQTATMNGRFGRGWMKPWIRPDSTMVICH